MGGGIYSVLNRKQDTSSPKKPLPELLCSWSELTSQSTSPSVSIPISELLHPARPSHSACSITGRLSSPTQWRRTRRRTRSFCTHESERVFPRLFHLSIDSWTSCKNLLFRTQKCPALLSSFASRFLLS